VVPRPGKRGVVLLWCEKLFIETYYSII